MRHAVTAGWLGGVIVILAGLPLPAALAVPVSAAGSALAFRQWSGTAQTWFRSAARRFRFRRPPETGSSVERA